MPKIREILRHVKIEVAASKRKCNRKAECSIERGERHLAIYGGPRNSRKNYCRDCAKAILQLASTDLKSIIDELYS